MAVATFATLGERCCQMTEHESERKTRKTRIDPKLPRCHLDGRACGRTPSRRAIGVAIEEYETALGPADYVLADGGACWRRRGQEADARPARRAASSRALRQSDPARRPVAGRVSVFRFCTRPMARRSGSTTFATS